MNDETLARIWQLLDAMNDEAVKPEPDWAHIREMHEELGRLLPH